MPRCPSSEPPTPPLHPEWGRGRGQTRRGGRSRSPPAAAHKALHLLASKLLPGLRGSEGLGCPLRWSAGRSHSLSQHCPLPRLSASSSPPLAPDPDRSSARLWGPRGHPLRPGGADSGPVSEAQLHPAGPPPTTLGRTHPPPQRSDRVWISPHSPGGGAAQPRAHAPTCAAAGGRERGRRAPGPSPAPRRACPCAAAAAAAAALARWPTGELPGGLLAGASCGAGQRTFPGRSRGPFPACLDL